MDIDTQKRWTHQLIVAIRFLDSQNIIHRDIKPGNIFVVERQLQDDTLQFYLKLACNTISPVGTVRYTAPEMDNITPYDRNVDVWYYFSY